MPFCTIATLFDAPYIGLALFLSIAVKKQTNNVLHKDYCQWNSFSDYEESKSLIFLFM